MVGKRPIQCRTQVSAFHYKDKYYDIGNRKLMIDTSSNIHPKQRT